MAMQSRTVPSCLRLMSTLGIRTTTKGRQPLSLSCVKSYQNSSWSHGYSTSADTTPDLGSLKPFDEIPGPNTSASIFNLSYWWKDFRMFMSQADKFYDMRFQQYPSGMFRENIGPMKVVHLGNPQTIEEYYRQEDKYPRRIKLDLVLEIIAEKGRKPGLFHLEGEEWHRTRRALDHLMMRPRQLLEYTHTLNDVSKDFVDRLGKLQQHFGSDKPIPNMNKELWLWSIESIGALLYESRFESFGESLDPRVKEMVNAISDFVDTIIILVSVPPKLAKVIFAKVYKKSKAAQIICYTHGDAILNEKLSEISQKLAAGEVPSGFLSQLMAEKNLTSEEISSNVADMMFAAVDTTSTTMQWILYTLSRHPDVQTKVYEEVKAMYTDAGTLDKSHIQHMHYVKAVIKETMRIYPAAYIFSRRTTIDMSLQGYHIPPGTMLFACPYATGRNPDNFPEPLEFRPERWLRENKQSINAFASLPFGVGTRMCIGRRVAELEMQLLIAQLVQRFHILPGDTAPLLPKPRFMFHPDRPVSLILKARK